MKVIGIQIDGSNCIICAVEKTDQDIELLKESKKLTLKEHHDTEEVKNFQKEIFLTFDTIQPTKIAVRVRQHKSRKGQNPPSALSFKIEGLIQLYDKIDVEFIWPQTISSFKKKNNLPKIEQFNYQTKAAEIATYLIEND